VTERLDALMAGEAGLEDLDVIAYRLATCTDGNRCYLPVEERRVVSSLLQAFPEDVADALGGDTVKWRGLVLPKIVDFGEHGVIYDEEQMRKEPDWTFRA
jgi:NADH-quinone oxidoreductase subunit F